MFLLETGKMTTRCYFLRFTIADNKDITRWISVANKFKERISTTNISHIKKCITYAF